MEPGHLMTVFCWDRGPDKIEGSYTVRFKGKIGSGGNGEVWRVSKPIYASSNGGSSSNQSTQPIAATQEELYHPAADDCALKVVVVQPFQKGHIIKQKVFNEYIAAAAPIFSQYTVRVDSVGHLNCFNGHQYPCILMELAPQGCLLDKVCPGGIPKGLPPLDTARIMSMVLEGIADIHGNNFIHRDIKPQNILLFGDEAKPTPKLTDFGSAARVSTYMGNNDKQVGTPGYEAPEMVQGLGQDGTTDVYLFGKAWLHVRWGKMPFWYLSDAPGDSTETLKAKEGRRGDLVADLQHPECPYTNGEQAAGGQEKLTAREVAMLSKCLQTQANARPKVHELCKDVLIQMAKRSW
jgi:serine/threonine protein kinase